MNIPTLEECRPGLRATGFTVLVALADPEKITKGGIILTEQTVERESMKTARGRVVSVSPAAFDYADFAGQHAKLGDIVAFAQYAGIIVKGDDGRDYRLLQDKEVWGIIEEAPALEMAA
jgi:co-chaperonin GroES (HSP10)